MPDVAAIRLSTEQNGRPFSDSPAPPHPNDQFAGLADGGMHADEIVKPTETTSSEGSENVLTGTMKHGNVTPKSAIKPGSRGSNANGKEKSVRSNTQSNRNMNSDIPRDEEFYDKD